MNTVTAVLLRVLAVTTVTTPGFTADNSQQLDEIIVSARRVDERLQDVPISVTVLSGARLEDGAVTRWEDLTLPGIKIGPAGLTDVLSIRGIASGINFGFEQSAPVFIDGVWFGSSRSSRIGFLDTERVEILKGPQPTYFGKNAIAGAFGIVTRKPQQEFSADFETYYEFEHDEIAITGVLNLPLGERLAARLAGRWRDLEGYMTNSEDGHSSPHQEDEMGRLALRWEPVETLTLDGKLEYSGNLTTGRETQYTRCMPQAFTTPRLLNPEFEDCRMDAVRGFRYDSAAFGEAMTLFEDPNRPGERLDNELLSGRIAADWEYAPGYSMKVNVAYYDQVFEAWVKQDNAWNQRSLAAYKDSSRLFSQELRIDSPTDTRWFWTVGGYREEVSRDNAPFTQLALQGSFALTTNWQEDSDAWAVFGELGLQLSDSVTVNAGGRYTEARRGIEADRSGYQLAPNFLVAGPDPWSFAVPTSVTQMSFISTEQSRRDDKFTPAISLEWRPRVGQMYYVSWREGFKAGGFSSFLAGPIDQIGFDPETVEYWEAGLKLRSPDGIWQVSAAVFDGEYQDLQVAIVDPATGQGLTRNAGGAYSRGVDLDFAWVFVAHWQLAAGLSYLDAEYEDFQDVACYPTPAQTIAQGCVRTGGAALPPGATLCQGNQNVNCAQDLSGFPTSFAPEWSGTFSTQYRNQVDIAALAKSLVLSAGFEMMTTAEYFTSVNGAPGSLQESFTKLDARVAIGDPDGRWDVALVGRNLTDEIYSAWSEPLVGAGLNTGWFATTARPRQLGVQLRLGF
jgi:outer membrane receptor protein involved in Fe transport